MNTPQCISHATIEHYMEKARRQRAEAVAERFGGLARALRTRFAAATSRFTVCQQC